METSTAVPRSEAPKTKPVSTINWWRVTYNSIRGLGVAAVACLAWWLVASWMDPCVATAKVLCKDGPAWAEVGRVITALGMILGACVLVVCAMVWTTDNVPGMWRELKRKATAR